MTTSPTSMPGSPAADPTAGPVFIGGLSHTGKTPLRIALGAHPRLSMTRGTGMWTNHHARYGPLARPRNVQRCIAAVSRDPAIVALGTDVERLRRAFAAGPATYARLFALIHEQHARRVGAVRWGEQLRRVEHYADPIFAAFPDARMIHMVRDPRAWLVDLATGGRAGSLGRAIAQWTASVELAARNAARYAGRYRVVRYEDLLAQPDAVLRDLAAFIGEADDDAMLRALHTTTAANGRARSGERDAGRALSHALVQRYARHHLLALGYAVAPGPVRTHLSGVRHPVDRGVLLLHDAWARRRPVPGASRRAMDGSRAAALRAALGGPSPHASVVEGAS